MALITRSAVPLYEVINFKLIFAL